MEMPLVLGRGLDHEGTKRAKDTKHEGDQSGISLGPGLRASWVRSPDSSITGQESVTSSPSVFWHNAENFKVRFYFVYPKNAGVGV
jgi:hypothetical protein